MESNDIQRIEHELLTERLGFWVYYPQTGRESWSEGFKRILKIAAGGEYRLFDFFPELESRIQNAVESGKSFCLAELTLPNLPGIFLFSLEISYNQANEPERIDTAVNHLPVYEQEASATSTKTVYDILEAFTQTPDSIVFSTDAEGNYTFLSGTGLKYLDLDPEYWLGRSVFEFLKDAPDYQKTIRKVLQGEYIFDQSQFGGHYFEDRFCPVYGPHNNFLGIVGIQVDVTDKILAEKSLREKTDLLTGLFDGIPENAYILDLDYTILEVNASAKNDFPGISLVGEKCFRVLHDRDTPCDFCPIPKTLQTGVPTKKEHQDPRTGNYHALENIPIRDKSSGEIVGFTAFVRDITVHKRILETTQRNEDFLNMLLEVLTDGIYLIDTNYVITRCNKKVDETYPHLAPLIGRKCYETTSNNRVCHDCAAEAMFREGRTMTRTFYERNNESEPGGWYELTASPQFDFQTGTINGAICIVRDVTPRIDLESQVGEYRVKIQQMAERQMDELRMSEARLRSILETSGVAISFADYMGRFTYINGKYREMLGYSEEEIYGKHVTMVLDPDNRDSLTQAREQIDMVLTKEHGQFRMIQKFRTKEGRYLWGDINVSVIHGNHPEETQMISAIVDVTAQQEWNRRLAEAKIAAEGANEAKSQFLATMSHEIRTPLNGVIGISNLLLETTLLPKQLEYAQLIKASGESLLFLINDILDFSKIEAGMLELDRIPFNLYQTVESVVGIMASRASESSLELAVTFEPEVPKYVFGDPGRLRQILINLVGNGLKFTHEGGVRIHVSLCDQIGNRQADIRFDVSDTGIGIPPDRLDRLFKRFSQVDASSARLYGGTGLGLAISKKLVELMGGSIHVKSEEGKGSTFWFTAVLPEDERTDRPEPDSTPGAKTRSRADLSAWKGENAFICCGNSIQRPALVDQLQSWGFKTRSATTSRETLERLRETKAPACRMIVIDSTVEDTDGEHLIRAIQDDPSIAALPIIYLSPLSEEPRQKAWRFPERIRFVSKPFQQSSFFDAVVCAYYGPIDEKDGKQPDRPRSDRDKARVRPPLPVHVLVAEDNRVNQIVICDILKNAGIGCTVVGNGHEAVNLIRERRFDLVLMDCQMPVLDGYDATRILRKWEKERPDMPRLPIIALTANATSEDEAKCLSAGMDAYCVKPIHPEKIISIIMQWTGKE